jgi:hypothetical protein
MFQKELVVVSGIAGAVFVSVALFASLAVRTVQRDAKTVAEDTLPGLVNAGDAINRINENWFDANLLLNLDSKESRSNLIQKINANSTAPLWQSYSKAIFDQQDAQLFNQMESNRTAFTMVRKDYFNLIQADKLPEARQLLVARVEPAFVQYHNSAVNLFRLNAEIGRQRADRIIRLSWWTPYALGGFCVMILLVGVFVGFKASLGAFSGVWLDKAENAHAKRLKL